MVHKKEEGTYHYIEKLTKDMPRFLSLSLDSSEYSGVNKDQRIPDRSKTAHRKPPVKCFLTMRPFLLTGTSSHSWERVSRPQHLHIQIQNGLLSSFFSTLVQRSPYLLFLQMDSQGDRTTKTGNPFKKSRVPVKGTSHCAGGCWLSISVAPGAENGERSLRELALPPRVWGLT